MIMQISAFQFAKYYELFSILVENWKEPYRSSKTKLSIQWFTKSYSPQKLIHIRKGSHGMCSNFYLLNKQYIKWLFRQFLFINEQHESFQVHIRWWLETHAHG